MEQRVGTQGKVRRLEGGSGGPDLKARVEGDRSLTCFVLVDSPRPLKVHQ